MKMNPDFPPDSDTRAIVPERRGWLPEAVAIAVIFCGLWIVLAAYLVSHGAG